MTKISDYIDRYERYLVIFLMAVLTILAFTQVLFRFVIKYPLPWSEELMRILFVWSCFIGAAAGVKKGVHVSVTCFVRILPKTTQLAFRYIIILICIIFCILVIINGFKIVLMQYTYGQVTAAMELPMWCGYSAVPIGALLLVIHFTQNLIKTIKER